MSFNNCSKTEMDNLPIYELKQKLTICNKNFTFINWLKIHYQNFIDSNPENLENSNSLKIQNPVDLISNQNPEKFLRYEILQNQLDLINNQNPAKFLTNENPENQNPISFSIFKNSENYQNSNDQIYAFISSILIFLICILLLNMISNYLSKILKKIDKKYNMSLVIISLLFMILNFSDDFMVLIFNRQKNDFFQFGLGYLMCNFLIFTCIIFGLIVFYVKIDLKQFKIIFFKDIFFIGIFFILVSIFGFLEIPYFVLAFLLLSLYLIYFIYSIFFFELRFIIKKNSEDKELVKENKDNLKEEEDIEENEKKELQTKKDENLEETTIKSEIWEIDTNLPYKLLYRVFISPIKLFFLLTIPYPENPLIKSNMYYLIIFLSNLTNMTLIFLFFEITIKIKLILMIASISLLITITLYIALKFEIVKKNIFLINIFFSILSLLIWMNLFIIFLLEVVYYFNFLFDHNSSFLNVFLPAYVNCISDFFTILSIVKINNGVLAFLSIFSYQVFFLYTGLFIILIFGNGFYFNIFYYLNGYAFVLVLFFFAIGSLAIHAVYGLVFQGKYFKYIFVFWFFYIFAALFLSLVI